MGESNGYLLVGCVHLRHGLVQPDSRMEDLTDTDLERLDWYILVDYWYVEADSMYELPRKIVLRLITNHKPIP